MKTPPISTLLILIDTLRADHLGCYGYARQTSPHIDSLSRESLLYPHAFSPCSFTLPSLASLFTSKYVSFHSVGLDQKFGRIDPHRDTTLAQVLKTQAAIKTSAFVGSILLRRSTNLCLGFDDYHDVISKEKIGKKTSAIKDGKYTTQEVIEWLKENAKVPFFLFVHYMDVHGPYLNPSPFHSLFTDDAWGGVEPKLLPYCPDGVGGIPFYQKTSAPYPRSRDVRYFISQYDGGIAYTDSLVGQLLNTLKELGLYNQSLVIITSDHGEALGENNVYFNHGLTVTHDQIHVPLILKPPQSWNTLPQTMADSVSLIDIMPTILEGYQVPFGQLSLQGTPLPLFSSSQKRTQGFLTFQKKRWIQAETHLQEAFLSDTTIFLYPKYKHKNKMKTGVDQKSVYTYKSSNNSLLHQTGESEKIRLAYWVIKSTRIPFSTSLGSLCRKILSKIKGVGYKESDRLLSDFFTWEITLPQLSRRGKWYYYFAPVRRLIHFFSTKWER